MRPDSILPQVFFVAAIVASFIAFPATSSALTLEDAPVQATRGRAPFLLFPDNQPRQDHLQGELILKFRDDASVGAVAADLVKGGQPFAPVTGDGNLDRLNSRYKVKAMHRVFGEAPALNASGRMDAGAAELRHRRQREKFRKDVAALREERLKKKGLPPGAPGPDLPYLGSIYRVEVDPETDVNVACAAYSRDPSIAYCQPNFRMEAQWIPNDPFYASFSSWGQGYDDLWGLKKMQMADAWDVTKGAGIVVAVVDSGVDYNHVDLATNIWTNSREIPGNGIDDDGNGYVDDVRGWDFYNNDNDPMDGHGHGTHVSGTIAAVGDNNTGIVGVAPLAKIMAVKGLSDTGSGSSAGLAAAIKYAAYNGAEVINNSWGCSSPCSSNAVAEDAVAYARGLGAVVVFAAGNSQADVTLYSPQNQSNNVITVAASSEVDSRSYFSNLGPLIDVAAPGGGSDDTSSNRIGRNILSLRAGSTDLYKDGLCIVDTYYYRARGTSMAAPNASGVAALVLAAHPTFTPDDVSQALRVSADDMESTGFDLLSGTGRLNAKKAVAVTSVPRVRITSPMKSVNVTKPGTVTVQGDAYGTKFAGYRLFYAPIDKVLGQTPYTPTVGSWQPLGSESTEAVTEGVLATFSTELFQAGKSYLLKLEVTTTDNEVFTDVKEILFFKEDPKFYILATGQLGKRGPQSEGDRFSWIETEPQQQESGTKRDIGKVYDGATNRLITIYPDPTKTGAWIDQIFLTGGKIVWYETNYSYGKTSVGSISPTGELVVEDSFFYPILSYDNGKILLNQGRAAFYGLLVYVYDVNTHTLSQEYAMPQGDPSQSGVYLKDNSVVTNMWYPGGSNNDVTINLTDLGTGVNEVVKTVVGGGAGSVRQALNGSGVVVWTEENEFNLTYPMYVFNKITKQETHVTDASHPYSYATDGTSIIFSAFGSETGETKLNLYSYDIATATTSFYASNYVAGATNNMWPSFGTRHVQWWADPLVMVRNDVPTVGGVSDTAVALNSLFSLTMTAADPEGDKVDISAVGGTWPDAATALPEGATFTDNGNGTGTLHWTPTTLGNYTISFLARDFSGRKEGSWNAVKTASFMVYDANEPSQPLGVTVVGNGTVNSSPSPDLNCSGGTCSQSYTRNTVVTLTASPGTDSGFGGWTGACSGFGACSVTMDQPRMVTATFIPSYILSVTIWGNGSVHSSPGPDIACSIGTCSQTFNSVTTVTLSATPAPGYAFTGWSGACSGGGSCVITTNQLCAVTATFVPTYSLDVTISGSGTVHSTPTPDINCSTGTCSGTYNSGTTVTLSATPAKGFAFTGWSGACSGTGSCTVVMDAVKNATATFTRTSAVLSLNFPLTIGNVHSSPSPDISCTSGGCTQTYGVDTVVTLTASPGATSYFGFWSGACSSNGTTCTLTMSEDRSVNAYYYGCGSMVSSACYAYIQEALTDSPDGSIIKARDLNLGQSLVMDRPVSLTLQGGYDSSFTTLTGTAIIPVLTIKSGTLTVSDITLK
ncbi:serine protease, subtilase family [Geotalea daltonii FRC-32]|uniref:Serine protease, subtilase family n=1 Tax=Geotalea daltonii (strain DSM 22248 / JCM 15807 / FRC-32) TaxID=316067 RepID=B9M7Z1_GEODF|nr:S8 family serine peptidase [Geotalea daltonii]ACM18449.1 serine protease, subtilase family [Geotalea daltonii FRC-32]